MPFFRTVLLVLLVVALLVDYGQSFSVQPSSLARHTALSTKRSNNGGTNRDDIRMVIDIAVEPESSKANVVETTPDKVTKQFSSSRVSSINLLKNCLGAGVFSLNAKVSAISTSSMTILPASIVVLTMALWATYNFYMVSAIKVAGVEYF